MKYETPEMTALTPAINAIESLVGKVTGRHQAGPVFNDTVQQRTRTGKADQSVLPGAFRVPWALQASLTALWKG